MLVESKLIIFNHTSNGNQSFLAPWFLQYHRFLLFIVLLLQVCFIILKSLSFYWWTTIPWHSSSSHFSGDHAPKWLYCRVRLLTRFILPLMINLKAIKSLSKAVRTNNYTFPQNGLNFKSLTQGHQVGTMIELVVSTTESDQKGQGLWY